MDNAQNKINNKYRCMNYLFPNAGFKQEEQIETKLKKGGTT